MLRYVRKSKGPSRRVEVDARSGAFASIVSPTATPALPMSHSTATTPIPSLNDGQMLYHGLDKWNAQPGALWNIRAEWDADAWARHLHIEGQIFNGARLLNQPGPFKRIGAFAAFNQYWPCFRLRDALSGEVLTPESMALWVPRVTLWLLPFYARSLIVAGIRFQLQVACPTAHFQTDLLCYLRSLYRVLDLHPAYKEEMGILTERIITLGLIIEAATYATTSGMEPLRNFTEGAGPCIAVGNEELHIDLVFNEPRYLDDAGGLGLN